MPSEIFLKEEALRARMLLKRFNPGAEQSTQRAVAMFGCGETTCDKTQPPKVGFLSGAQTDVAYMCVALDTTGRLGDD